MGEFDPLLPKLTPKNAFSQYQYRELKRQTQPKKLLKYGQVESRKWSFNIIFEIWEIIIFRRVILNYSPMLVNKTSHKFAGKLGQKMDYSKFGL